VPSTEPLYSLFATAIGLVLGSFFNVLIYRLPREESIVRPGSHCPRCGHPVRWWENIPVVSYCALLGKCAHCKTTISPMYPAIELLTGLAALALWRFYAAPALSAISAPWQVPVVLFQSLTLLTMIPLFVIDCEHYIIPDLLTVPGFLLAILFSFFPGGLTPVDCALGIAAGGGSLYAIGLLGKILLKKDEAMGGGDVRLMALVGALWGWKIAIASIFIASLTGSLAGLALLLLRKLGNDRKIPFGPFLAAGLWIAVFASSKLTAWYFDMLDRVISG
jgi:leader peptidase (prepilin peptidase) / N-methyltransferase